MGTPMLDAAALLINSFRKHAGTDGDEKTLSMCEFKALLEAELCSIEAFKEGVKKEQLDDLMKKFDKDNDQKIDLDEFTKMIADVALTNREAIMPLADKVRRKK